MSSKRLSDVIICCPSFRGVTPPSLEALHAEGASIHRMPNRSDIAHVRCLLAESALREAERDDNKRWILWCDDDQEFPLETVVRHRVIARHCSVELGTLVALAGRYVRRAQPEYYAAVRVGASARICRVSPNERPTGMRANFDDDWSLPEVYSGMGAFMCPLAALRKVAEMVPRVEPVGGRDPGFAAVTHTGAILNEQQRWCWGPEDFVHCALLGMAGTQVLLAPGEIAYGHWVKTRDCYVYPDDTTLLPDSDPWVPARLPEEEYEPLAK